MAPLFARRIAATGVTAVLAALLLVPAAAASAHSALVDSTPAAGATVTTALTEVSLSFNETVLDLGDAGSSSRIEVTDASGLHYETACSVDDGREVTIPVALGMTGEYTVTYSVVSADGHRIGDEFAFTYQPEAGTAAAEGTEASTCADVIDSGDDTVEAGPSENQIVLFVAGAIVILATIGVVLAIVLTRRRPAE